MRPLTIFTIIMLCLKTYSQEIYLKIGKNYTQYNYSTLSSNTIALDLNSGNGNFYEIGYNNEFKKEGKSGYKFGMSLNEYNATASSSSNFYSWNTSYIGIQGSIYYRPIHTTRVNVIFLGGLLFNKMIYGKQVINKTVYDLHSNNEFNGIYVHPLLGTEINIQCHEAMSLLIGYQFSFSSGILQNSLVEQTSFINHQIQFGIKYKL